MRRFVFVIMLLTLALAACNNRKCLIEGTVSDSNLNGKRIFLVPVFYEDSLGVDSVVIQNNRFQFERDQEFLADIRVDYHYRYNTENLLVVTEPGNIKVSIDVESKGGGTPQNDSLQVWKELLMQRNSDITRLRKEYVNFLNDGDSASAAAAKANIDAIIAKFNDRTRQMAQNLKSGTLYDFLIQRVPKGK